MFKVGDNVICIDANKIDDGVNVYNFLTFGKSYKLYEVYIRNSDSESKIIPYRMKISSDMVFVLNDMDRCVWYEADKFISLKKYRKQKLEKLCSKLEM